MSKKYILAIDDDKSVLGTYTRILKRPDFQIDIAETGKEALDMASKHKYDLAIIDVKLPDMDGIELLSLMSGKMDETIKIMITGFPSVEMGVKALDEGADAYLVKPIDPKELVALVEEKLQKIV